MPQLFRNNVSSTIYATITTTSTIVKILNAAAKGFPTTTVGGNNYFYATLEEGTNVEVVKATAQSFSSGTTTYTIVRNIDGGGAHAFTTSAKMELRIPAKSLNDLQFPPQISNDREMNYSFGFPQDGQTKRLQGGDIDASVMGSTNTTEHSLTYGSSASYWTGSATATQSMHNKSNGGVVLGRGAMNHGWSEGGAAIGFGCMVGVSGGTQDANGATALGWFTNAYRMAAFAAGGYNQAFGAGSTSLGWGCTASDAIGNVALGEGCVTPVTNPSSGVYTTFAGCVAVGRFNKFDDNKHYTFCAGVGDSAAHRFNGFYIRKTTTNWATYSGNLAGASGVGFPTLGKSTRFASDSNAGNYGVLSGELYVNTSGYVMIKT